MELTVTMSAAWLATFRIPLIGRGQVERLTHEREQSLRPISVTKPSRYLGAVYMDEKVQQRRPVVLCSVCNVRYRNWHRKVSYRGDWGWTWIGDCDGCGLKGCLTTFYHAEERFYDALTQAHGRGKPN